MSIRRTRSAAGHIVLGIDFLHEVRAKTAAWAGPSVSDDLGFLDKLRVAERVANV
jgi:hypothetical protein